MQQNDIRRKIEQLQQEDQKINQEIEEELVRPETFGDCFPDAGVFSKLVCKIHSCINQVHKDMTVTKEIWERATERLSQLHAEKVGIESRLQEIEVIREINRICKELEESIKKEDYIKSAHLVKEYLELNNPSDAEIDRKVQAIKQSLLKMFLKHINQPSAIDNKETIRKLNEKFYLLNLIKEKDVSMTQYKETLINFLFSKLNFNLLLSEKEDNYFINVLTKYFEFIANIIGEFSNDMDILFGTTGKLAILDDVLRAVDSRIAAFLRLFMDQRSIAKTVRQIESEDAELVGSREVDRVCHEISVVCQRSFLFDKYVESTRCQTQAEAGISARDAAPLQLTYQTYVGELLTGYLVLEKHFLKAAISKAVEIDQVDMTEMTSSLVDDVFYIFRKVVARALLTYNTNIIAAMVNFVSISMDEDCIAVLRSGALAGEGGATINSRIVALNNAELCIKYLDRFASQLGSDVDRLALSSHDAEKIRASISQLPASQTRLRQLLQSGIDGVFKGAVRGKLRQIFQTAFRQLNCVASNEAELDAGQKALVAGFAAGFTELVQPLRKAMSRNTFNLLVKHCFYMVAVEWERMLDGMRFTQIGALSMDKSVHEIATFFGEWIDCAKFKSFVRLRLVVRLLAADSVAEALDYLRVVVSDTPLTTGDAKRLLGLRIDWSAENIVALQQL